MAKANSQHLVPLVANADLSAAAKQYTIVKMAANNKVDTATAATAVMVGVQQDRGKAGEAVAVAILGICKVKAGAGITFGQRVTADGSGRAVATTTDKDNYVGIVITGVSNADEIAEILLTPGGLVSAT